MSKNRKCAPPPVDGGDGAGGRYRIQEPLSHREHEGSRNIECRPEHPAIPTPLFSTTIRPSRPVVSWPGQTGFEGHQGQAP